MRKKPRGKRPSEIAWQTELAGIQMSVTRDTEIEPDEHQRVKAAFLAAYRSAYGAEHSWGAKQGAQLKHLVKQQSAVEIERRIGMLFGGGGPSWITPPFDLGTLVQHFDKLVIAPHTGRLTPAQIASGAWRRR